MSDWRPAFANLPALLESAGSQPDDGYYGVPILKEPKWGWEIALYFFCEGISSGAFLLGTLMEWRGGRRELVRAAHYLALAALAPCPPLLIADLGRPERFHHMLRVFKPTSPMNLGAWALSAYSLPVFGRAAADWFGLSPSVALRMVSLAGLPFALTMLSYPGVLLETTSVPLWRRTPFLGPLLAASSISAASAALSLIAHDRGVERIERVAAAVEGAALAGFLAASGNAPRVLVGGRQTFPFWFGAGLLAASLWKGRRGRAASLLAVGGSLLIKWAITYAGKESAFDVRSALAATQPAPPVKSVLSSTKQIGVPNGSRA